jgi:hypothetical protein
MFLFYRVCAAALLLLAPLVASWAPNFAHQGALVGSSLESTPLFYRGSMYLMASEMSTFGDGGAHSYFCIYDLATGERLNCPLASLGHAFCSALVDAASVPGTETLWVFCSAWDRANHTSCAKPGWGCGACADPAGGCYVGSFACSAPDVRDCGNSWNFTKALTLPGHVTVPNVAVGLVPHGANPPNTSLPRHQAFMALETSLSVAVNVGGDGDLGANWLLLDPQQFAVQQVGDGGLCPFARYNAADGYFYVAGGGHHVNLARSRTLQLGSWSNPPASPAIAVGCTDRAEDCSPGSPVARLSGYYSGYVSGGALRGGVCARALARLRSHTHSTRTNFLRSGPTAATTGTGPFCRTSQSGTGA